MQKREEEEVQENGGSPVQGSCRIAAFLVGLTIRCHLISEKAFQSCHSLGLGGTMFVKETVTRNAEVLHFSTTDGRDSVIFPCFPCDRSRDKKAF